MYSVNHPSRLRVTRDTVADAPKPLWRRRENAEKNFFHRRFIAAETPRPIGRDASNGDEKPLGS